jgi:hypothetical protein
MLERVHTLPRRVRRLIVLESFVAYPVVVIGYATLVAGGLLPGIAWAPIALVGMLGFVGGLFVIYLFARDRANPDEPSLDERQRALAFRAMALSYGLLVAFVVAIAAVYAIYVTTVGPLTLGPELLLPVAIGVGVYLPVLPSAVLAWIEPDGPPEDEPLGDAAEATVAR